MFESEMAKCDYSENCRMTTNCLPKRQDLKKNQPKISFFTMSEKENPWSEDETDTGTTTEANEPIEVDVDVSHEAIKNKESFSPVGRVYTRG
jgi:hypothetical protein